MHTQPPQHRPLLDAVLAGQRPEARRIIREHVDAGRSISTIFREIIGPALAELGERWARAEIDVATEHLASRSVADCLEMLRHSATPNPPLAARAVIACADGEYHELGPRMVADLLELDGWHVDFLGAATPPRDLAHFVAQSLPVLVGLSATLPERATDVRLCVTHLAALEPRPAVLIGGSVAFLDALELAPGVVTQQPDVRIVRGDAVDAVIAARDIVTARSSPLTLEDYLAALGGRVQRLRKARGWSQAVLARQASLDRTYISALEHGRQNLTVGAIFKLASALEIGLHDLLVGDEPRFRDLP